MKHQKHFIVIILVIFLSVLVSSIVYAEKREEEIAAASFINILNNAYCVVVRDGHVDAGADLGIKVDTFDANLDVNVQLSQIEDAIASGKYQIFSLMPIDAMALPPIVDKALQAGIIVIAHNNPIGRGPDVYETEWGMVSYVGHRTINVGKAAGELAIEALDGSPGNVVIISGDPSMQMTQDNNAGFQMAIESHPEIEIIANQSAYWDRGKAISVMEDFLQTHSDIDVMYCHDDNMTVGAVQAIAEAGRTDEIKVVSLGGMKEAFREIEDGRMYGTVMFLPYEEGYRSIEYAYKQLNGEGIPDFINLANDPILKGRGIKVTKENIQHFTPEY
jgi:ribose transport system substrate-binding protein